MKQNFRKKMNMRFTSLLLLLVLSSCNKPKPTTCSADSTWITNPTMPSEVASAETFCDFYQFSWQWFLAQVSPDNESDELVLFQNRVYQPNGGTDQCDNEAVTGLQGAMQSILKRAIKPSDFEDQQADGNAVYDQNGNILYFNVFYSQQLCDAKSDGFVKGTLEVKVSWRIVPEDTPHEYFTVKAMIPDNDDEVTLGMLGIHLAIWTPNHPEMIWATWEHKANAPLCDGSSHSGTWTLSSQESAECLKENPQNQSGLPNSECDSFKFNTPESQIGTPASTGEPNNVCREYAYGNQDVASVNGNDNTANLNAIKELNEALVGTDGLLTKLPEDNPMHVWSNYEMIGGLWTKDGAESGSPPVPSKQGEPNVDSPQRGSLELTNMSMETFQQGDSSFVPNCFGCHNYKKDNPLGVSHISQFLISE